MSGSDAGYGSLPDESHSKHQHTQVDTTFPHSLASTPAGLEVVPTDDKQFQQAEKETVQELPEAISQAEKEVSNTWAISYETPTPLEVPIPLQDHPAERRTCGLKRKSFWIILVVASSVIALALIIGLGAGLGLRRPRKQASCDSSILSTAKSLVNLLESGVSGVVKDQDDAEKRYTLAMVRQLRLENPNKNVIIFRNPDSVVHFDGDAAHCRTKLDLGLGFAPEYETYVFDYGVFTLVGPRDYTNWCFDGNYSQGGNQVTFNGISLPGDELQAAAPKAPALPPSSPARLDAGNADGNYFVNCSNPDGSTSSGMAYYAQLNPGQNVGHKPNDYVDVNNRSYIDWTHPGAITFPNTSVTVHWSVFGGSEEHAVNSTVGTANNGYEFFWIFKDTGQFLYRVDDWTCYSAFWAY